VRRNNAIILVFAVVMGLAAALLSRHWLITHAGNSGAAARIGTIVVATRPLAFGTSLAPDNVKEISWAGAQLPDGAYATTRDLLKDGGRVVLASLDTGEPVLRSKITAPGQRGTLSSLVKDGMRAVTVRVDDVRGVAGFILPGDFVDVILIGDDSSIRHEGYSETLLQHVKVLAIDQLASERQEHPTVAKAVTVEVTPQDAQKLLLASNVGKLSLVLRQPGDLNPAPDRRVTERDLGNMPPAPPVHVVAAPVQPPPPAVKPPPSDTVTVTIVRGTKREEYKVKRTAAD
jgi:pilus assembly protein CpaB